MIKKTLIIILTIIVFFLIYFLGLRHLFDHHIESIYLQGLIMGAVSGLLVFTDLIIFRKLKKQKKAGGVE